MTDKEKRILEVLKNSDNALSAKEIAVMMYGPDSTQQLVYSKLLKLEALGYVEKFYSKRSYKFIVNSDGNTVKLPKNDNKNSFDKEAIIEEKEAIIREANTARKETQTREKRFPKTEYNVYERENYLKLQFNEVWSSILKEKKDYYSYMDEHSLDLLRNAVTNLKDINTLKTTLAYIHNLKDVFDISDKEVNAIEESVRTAPPHYEGYDVEHKGMINIIAEIKCNMPVNNSNKFETVQINEIKRDLEYLIYGKEKSRIKNIDGFYRFLVIKKHGKNLGFAVEDLIKTLPIEISKFLLFYREGMIMSKDYVYIYILEK
jgi:Fe2+ or Zn2+ uptake regulation protein